MTNEEKALNLSQKYGVPKHKNREIAVYQSCVAMADWKDAQFKEYLEKKKEELEYKVVYGSGGYYTKQIAIIAEIINELFNDK